MIQVTNTTLSIRLLASSDIPIIVDGFANSGWTTKPANVFKQYLDEQHDNNRACFVAFLDNEFAGYVTLKWHADYKKFAKDNIPEISDLNVLPNFRCNSIGSALIEKCEKLAAGKSDYVGIGVGLYPDYGLAQRLYIKRGYIPDGHGATYNNKYVIPGKEYPLDDDLVLWFTKKINYHQLQAGGEGVNPIPHNYVKNMKKIVFICCYLFFCNLFASEMLHTHCASEIVILFESEMLHTHCASEIVILFESEMLHTHCASEIVIFI